MSRINERFAKIMVNARKAKKMSCQDLADLTGMSRATLTHIENRNQNVYLYQALKISEVLGFSLNVLIFNSEPEQEYRD